MALTTYDPPTLTTVAGTFTVRLYSSNASLTVPTIQTILEIGELTESVDSASGFTEISTLRLRVRDDYSTHTEGFWYKALAQTTTHIRVYLNEGSGDTFYFYGVPQQDATVWGEHSLFGGEYLREAEITLVSMATVLFDTATSTWCEEVAGDGLLVDFGNSTDSGERNDLHPTYYISLLNAFDSMLAASGLNSYASGDTSFVYSNQDFKFQYSTGNYRVDQLYLCTYYWDAAGVRHVGTEYWNIGADPNGTSLSTKFATLRDLLANLLPNIGCVMRMSYNTGTERHKIELVQRGQAYAGGVNLVFSSKEKTSEIRKAYDLILDAVRVTFLLDQATPTNAYYSTKYGNDQDVEPPNYINFDIDLQCIFRCSDGGGGFSFGGGPPAVGLSRFFYALVTGNLEAITDVEYWSYETDIHVFTTGNNMEDAIAGYLYYRFSNAFSMITRTYGTMAISNGSTSTHTNASILRRTSINDGTGAATYYANRVVKRPALNDTEIEWILE